MNGASDLAVDVFGDRGRHARTTIGVASLPLDAAAEVEGLFAHCLNGGRAYVSAACPTVPPSSR